MKEIWIDAYEAALEDLIENEDMSESEAVAFLEANTEIVNDYIYRVE